MMCKCPDTECEKYECPHMKLHIIKPWCTGMRLYDCPKCEPVEV